MKFHQIKQTESFKKDLKKLLKRFQTLADDLETFIKTQLVLFHKHHIDNKGIFPIAGLGFEKPKCYIVKSFACRALKGKGVKSGIRITYAYFIEEDTIEFIEIYYKGDQEIEDKEKIKEFYS